MEIKLLEKGYRLDEQLYQDFLNDKIDPNNEYFSKQTVEIKDAPDFPIYMAKGSETAKRNDFLQAFQIIATSYLNTDRELILDETFWHSLLVTHKRDYILEQYPEVQEGISKFRNIVLKKFDWENYIYKCILGAQYVTDNIANEEEHDRYYELIIDNLDVYNYIIKAEVFRNDMFLINILDIIDELNISSLMKAKIKGREDLGDDERYGRRVIFEFNKSYPVVMAPMLEKKELKKLFITYLDYYYDVTELGLDTDLTGKKDEKRHSAQAVHKEIASSLMDVSSFEESYQTTEMKTEELVANETRPSLLDKKEDVQAEETEFELLAYLKEHKLEYIDYRKRNGTFWVIGNSGIEPLLKPLTDYGIRFMFKPIGRRITENKPAWLWDER